MTYLIHLAEKLGTPALTPLFFILVILYALQKFLRLLRILNNYQAEKAQTASQAVSEASRTLSGLDRTAITDDEFRKIKLGLFRTAGIRIDADAQMSPPLLVDDVGSVSDQQNYNAATKRTFWLSLVAGGVFVPLVAINLLLQRYRVHLSSSGLAFSKLFSLNTLVEGEVPYSTALFVFVIIFAAVRLFVSRSGALVQTIVVWVLLLLIVYVVLDSFVPSCFGCF